MQQPEFLVPSRWRQPVLDTVQIRETCDDFRVVEIPKYSPCGAGEHLFVRIRKTDLAAADFLTLLTERLKVRQREIGIAGHKDRRAVTEQWISLPIACEPLLRHLDDDALEVLQVERHTNKLRTGHLAGNRFQLNLTMPSPIDSVTQATLTQRVQDISQHGFPNYYGGQRFGRWGRTFRQGRDVLRRPSDSIDGEKTVFDPPIRTDFVSKMKASAVQSAVFNTVVSQRIRCSDVRFPEPVSGDIVCRKGGIRPFAFDQRLPDEDVMLVPMGPMPGPKMPVAAGIVREWEQQVFETLRLEASVFDRRKATPGTRRAMLAWPGDFGCEVVADNRLCLRFVLPAGSYANVLLRELVASIEEGGR